MFLHHEQPLNLLTFLHKEIRLTSWTITMTFVMNLKRVILWIILYNKSNLYKYFSTVLSSTVAFIIC